MVHVPESSQSDYSISRINIKSGNNSSYGPRARLIRTYSYSQEVTVPHYACSKEHFQLVNIDIILCEHCETFFSDE